MFQLAVYAAIVVLTRHKIPIVSRGGEKREGGREAFRGLPCVTLIHRAFQHQAGLAGGEGREGEGTLNFPAVSQAYIHRASLQLMHDVVTCATNA